MALAFIALGSNLAHPRRQLARAARALGRLPATTLVALSPNYVTAPLGTPGPQPDYVNAVAALRTALAPHALLRRLQELLDQWQWRTDVEHRLVLLRRRKPRYTLVLAKPDAVVDLGELAADDLTSGTESTEDQWIEVLVLDDKDQPVANVEYEIELSDGRVQRGRTSEHGILRYEDLPSGSCKVRLLDVDGSSWDLA